MIIQARVARRDQKRSTIQHLLEQNLSAFLLNDLVPMAKNLMSHSGWLPTSCLFNKAYRTQFLLISLPVQLATIDNPNLSQ